MRFLVHIQITSFFLHFLDPFHIVEYTVDVGVPDNVAVLGQDMGEWNGMIIVVFYAKVQIKDEKFLILTII